MNSEKFFIQFHRSFVGEPNAIVMNIHPNINRNDTKAVWNGHIGLTVLEFTIRDENHRAELIREDALIIGNIAYLNRIENFSHTDHNLNATETKTLVDAYQVALDTAGKIEELLKCQAAFVEVYEAIGGHQYEHDKAMSQDLGVLKMKVEPVGLGHYFAFGEIWQSLDELKAYYLHRFPTVTFSVVDHGNKTVEELRARGHHLVRKGTRMVA